MITFGDTVSLAQHSPKVTRLEFKETAQELFAKLKTDRENVFLLESASGPSRLAEYSFIGFDPAQHVRLEDGLLTLKNEESGSTDRVRVDDPLDELRRLAPPDSASGAFRFVGGAVGYISYDSVNYWERVQSGNRDGGGFPEMEFGIFKDGIVFDHVRSEVYYCTLGKDRLEDVRGATKQAVLEGSLRASSVRPSMGRDKFEALVARAKEYIASGDIFQVVLSKGHDFEVEGDLGKFYAKLSATNPSPYMYFLKFGDRAVVGSSPEMLVRVENRRVETFPIAGTRPRVEDRRRNEELTKELMADPKENAEHVMLVDLARNDVGKVSKYGSVKTPEFLTVEQYSHVQHMVSHVVGELRGEFDSFDALRSLFPAGTVSGAPKVRAMEIIAELEPKKRGPYAGAVGYFSFNGNADFAITIRTLVARGKSCSVQAGAGIVVDSVPSKEWEETEAKAAGPINAVRLAASEQ